MALLDFPIVKREWRSRFRRNRAFVSLGALVLGGAWSCWSRLNDTLPAAASSAFSPGSFAGFAPLAHQLLVQLVWMQILGVCLLVPLECAPLIAREREIGSGDELLLTPLAPSRVALEKGAAGAGFIALVLLALFPLDLVALLLGSGAPSGLWAVSALLLGCLLWGASLGTACSAHSRRTRGALQAQAAARWDLRCCGFSVRSQARCARAKPPLAWAV